MQTMVPLYGFGGGGGTGAALTVTAPAGCTVTVGKDGKTKTRTAGADGVAVFKGLATGTWTLTITDGEQTAQKTVTVTADYSTAITFISATIHVTYPAGATCTATDGVTTLTAPDTSGTWDCVVQNAGTWTVSLDSGFCESVEITQSGEEKTIDKWYLYKNGNQRTDITGGWWKNTEYTWNPDAARPNIGTVRFDANSFYCNPPSDKSAFASTKNKINLHGFSTVKALVTIVERCDLVLATNSSGYLHTGNPCISIEGSYVNKEILMDIGTLQESYIAIGASGVATRSVTVYAMWLEV